MKLKYVLYMIGRRIKYRAKNDPDYKKIVARKDCTVQIKTSTGPYGRYYKFHDGTVSSKKGVSETPDATFVFKSKDSIFESFTKTDTGKSITEASNRGSMKTEGDQEVINWFVDLVDRS